MPLKNRLILEKEVHAESELIEIALAFKMLVTEKTCCLLSGDLAAGKTTFVNTFCRLMGISGVASPTFALHHIYSSNDVVIDHFDLYRLSSSDEVETTGLWEALAKQKCLVFIEWPQKIALEDIPLDLKIVKIDFKKMSETGRLVSINILN